MKKKKRKKYKKRYKNRKTKKCIAKPIDGTSMYKQA